jgi:alkylation response protein AidB-like acyl-CoA dehydrogenase
MNFELSEEQKLIQDTAREFAKAELEPVAARVGSGAQSAELF